VAIFFFTLTKSAGETKHNGAETKLWVLLILHPSLSLDFRLVRTLRFGRLGMAHRSPIWGLRVRE
jgi:hypothetical protein